MHDKFSKLDSKCRFSFRRKRQNIRNNTFWFSIKIFATFKFVHPIGLVFGEKFYRFSKKRKKLGCGSMRLDLEEKSKKFWKFKKWYVDTGIEKWDFFFFMITNHFSIQDIRRFLRNSSGWVMVFFKVIQTFDYISFKIYLWSTFKKIKKKYCKILVVSNRLLLILHQE